MRIDNGSKPRLEARSEPFRKSQNGINLSNLATEKRGYGRDALDAYSGQLYDSNCSEARILEMRSEQLRIIRVFITIR